MRFKTRKPHTVKRGLSCVGLEDLVRLHFGQVGLGAVTGETELGLDAEHDPS